MKTSQSGSPAAFRAVPKRRKSILLSIGWLEESWGTGKPRWSKCFLRSSATFMGASPKGWPFMLPESNVAKVFLSVPPWACSAARRAPLIWTHSHSLAPQGCRRDPGGQRPGEQSPPPSTNGRSRGPRPTDHGGPYPSHPAPSGGPSTISWCCVSLPAGGAGGGRAALRSATASAMSWVSGGIGVACPSTGCACCGLGGFTSLIPFPVRGLMRGARSSNLSRSGSVGAGATGGACASAARVARKLLQSSSAGLMNHRRRSSWKTPAATDLKGSSLDDLLMSGWSWPHRPGNGPR